MALQLDDGAFSFFFFCKKKGLHILDIFFKCLIETEGREKCRTDVLDETTKGNNATTSSEVDLK